MFQFKSKSSRGISVIASALALASVSLAAAYAQQPAGAPQDNQQQGMPSPTAGAANGNASGMSGTTSGPAVGSAATPGTGSDVGATSSQTDALRNHGGASVQSQRQGSTGNGAPVQPGASGAESGSPADGGAPPK